MLQQQLQPAVAIPMLVERYRFRQRRQLPEENVKEYVEELKKMANKCKFSQGLNEQLLDQFLYGIVNDSIRQRLFKEEDLDFIRAVIIASTLEAEEFDIAALEAQVQLNIVQKQQGIYGSPRSYHKEWNPRNDTVVNNTKTGLHKIKILEDIVDLIFEKAIENSKFSDIYAKLSLTLSTLKVPAENASNPDQCVNFRALIIRKCQKQFEANRTDEQVMKLEKEYNECTDAAKKKELHLMLQEEHRRVRMRSVGNVRFIGELYKLKMLTCKIIDYCMNYLIEKLEEEKLECLCILLTTIGDQIENEKSRQLDTIFKKMQNLVDAKSNKISSRVKFMIQDVIARRRSKWVVKEDPSDKMTDEKMEKEQAYKEVVSDDVVGGDPESILALKFIKLEGSWPGGYLTVPYHHTGNLILTIVNYHLIKL